MDQTVPVVTVSGLRTAGELGSTTPIPSLRENRDCLQVTSFLAPIAIVRSGFHCVYALHIPKSGFMSVDKRGTFFDKKFQFYYQNSLICFIAHASKSSCYLL